MKNIAIINEYLKDPLDLMVGELEADSRKIKEGDVFVAIKGQVQDGRIYIDQAIKQGASVILYENSDGFTYESSLAKCIGISDLNTKLPKLAAAFYDHPSQKLQVIGVTGTNGKSSITYYIAQMLASLGEKCAIIGTVGNGFIDHLETATNTTPGPIEIQRLLVQFKEAGAKYVAMEVSSHGIAQGRIDGIDFARTAFTNLSRDHLDFHKTIEAYFKVKEDFILRFKDRASVLNFDDPMIAQNLSPKLEPQYALTVGTKQGASYLIQAAKATDQGTEFSLLKAQKTKSLYVPLIGLFNVYNAIMALALVDSLVNQYDKLTESLSSLKPLVGRMQIYKTVKSPLCIVDYAHTPDGLEKAIVAAREHTKGELLVVVGCGGDRDHGKRPTMGKIATTLANYAFFTNDNPRTEDPKAIMEQIIAGVSTNNYEIEYDRKEAITKAIQKATVSDLVLIAGKGHEDYQIIGKQKLHFSDQEIVQEVLASSESDL